MEAKLLVLSDKDVNNTVLNRLNIVLKQEFYARAMAELPRILFGYQRGSVRYARLGLIKWLKYSPWKALRGKLPVRYQSLTLRFAVNAYFSFLNKLFGLKIDDK